MNARDQEIQEMWLAEEKATALKKAGSLGHSMIPRYSKLKIDGQEVERTECRTCYLHVQVSRKGAEGPALSSQCKKVRFSRALNYGSLKTNQ
jgi:hypothetical protein